MNAFEDAFANGSVQLQEFGSGLDSIEAVAKFICDPENNSDSMQSLRFMIRQWATGKLQLDARKFSYTGWHLRDFEQIPCDWEFFRGEYEALARQVFEAVANILFGGESHV